MRLPEAGLTSPFTQTVPVSMMYRLMIALESKKYVATYRRSSMMVCGTGLPVMGIGFQLQ